MSGILQSLRKVGNKIIASFKGGDTAEVLESTEALNVDSDGNVGIGTNSPEAKLHVKNDDAGISPSSNADELVLESNDHCGLSILGKSTHSMGIYFGSSTSNQQGLIVYDNATDGMSFYNDGAAHRMIIESGGNVGIGTTLPATRLHVEDSTGDVEIELKNGSSGKRYQIQNSSGDFVIQDLSTGRIGYRFDGTTTGKVTFNAGVVEVTNGAIRESLDQTARLGHGEIVRTIATMPFQAWFEVYAHKIDNPSNWVKCHIIRGLSGLPVVGDIVQGTGNMSFAIDGSGNLTYTDSLTGPDNNTISITYRRIK